MTESSSTSSPTPSSLGRAPLNAEDYSSLSDAQDKILALLPLLPSTLSIWGSASIIHMVLTSAKKTTPYRRILLALSICDLINSIAFPFQSFLLPADTSQRVWAIGNDATCTMLGWFNQFSFTSIWYSGMISVYFLLTVRFGKSEHWISKWVEPFMHVLSIGFPLVTASLGAALNMYHEYLIGNGCWIYEYPEGCQDCLEFPDTERPCCEGSFFGWVFGGLPTFFILLLIGTCNAVVYCHVRSTIRTSQQYLTSSVAQRRQSQRTNARLYSQQAKRIQAVGTQALLYVGAFAITYTCALSFKIMESLNYNAEDEDTLFPLLVMHQLTLPGLGFLNCLVFVRPSYTRVRKRHPNESRFWAFRRALHGDKIRASQVQTNTLLSQPSQPLHLQLVQPPPPTILSSNNNPQQPSDHDGKAGSSGNHDEGGDGAGGDSGGNVEPSSSLSPPLLVVCPSPAPPSMYQNYQQEEEEESMHPCELDNPGRGSDSNHNDAANTTKRYHQSAPELFEGLADFSATTRYRFRDILFDTGSIDIDLLDDDDEGDNDRDKNSDELDLSMKKDAGHMSMPAKLTSSTTTTTTTPGLSAQLKKHNRKSPGLHDRINSSSTRLRRNSHSNIVESGPVMARVVAGAKPSSPNIIESSLLLTNATKTSTTGHTTTTTSTISLSSNKKKTERRKSDSMIPLIQNQETIMDPVCNNNIDNNNTTTALEFFTDKGQPRGGSHHQQQLQQRVDKVDNTEKRLPIHNNRRSSSRF